MACMAVWFRNVWHQDLEGLFGFRSIRVGFGFGLSVLCMTLKGIPLSCAFSIGWFASAVVCFVFGSGVDYWMESTASIWFPYSSVLSISLSTC
jgi:hypothetical protein